MIKYYPNKVEKPGACPIKLRMKIYSKYMNQFELRQATS